MFSRAASTSSHSLGRRARAVRLPPSDAPSNPIPGNFTLNTLPYTFSHEHPRPGLVEAGQFRDAIEHSIRTHLVNEIHFAPCQFLQLQPRSGPDASAMSQQPLRADRACDSVLFTCVHFAEQPRGVFAKAPPKVMTFRWCRRRHTANDGVTWNIRGKNTSWLTRRDAPGAAAAWIMINAIPSGSLRCERGGGFQTEWSVQPFSSCLLSVNNALNAPH